jgi:hypothetical protein
LSHEKDNSTVYKHKVYNAVSPQSLSDTLVKVQQTLRDSEKPVQPEYTELERLQKRALVLLIERLEST